ncbi:MAG TPA: response regulator transcription factor [Thermomicrobiales bacterium]|nr:response regulator transcription factor [Thermomicrobiales bacterium]
MVESAGQALGARILVVEDEARLVRLIRAVLETQGYRVTVVPTGERALAQVALEMPDLVLLDLLLPGGMDGFEICRRIREFSMVPVVMLTASAREEEKLAGFDAGADDYITQPFSARELLARIQAVLRRTQVKQDSPAVIEIGELSINLASQRVSVAGEPVHLTPTEYRLLLALARQPDRVMTHTALLTDVWGIEYRDEVDYLRTYIRYLRQKLEPDPANPRYLITRPGVGYSLSTEG